MPAKAKPTGVYTGRLTYNSDAVDTDGSHVIGFHTDTDGNRVVTDDDGATWRYATDDDQLHYDRYHQQFANVQTTETELDELTRQHGPEKAEELMRQSSPHHYQENQ